MTCIVGLVKGRSIFMGADSAGVAGSSISARVDEKVFIKDSMIFGFTSSFRMGDLLRFKLKIPKHPTGIGTREYMVTDFIDAVRECLKDGGMANKNCEVETGGTFLVGYKKTIFHVGSDYQVGQRVGSFNVVGCGEAIALGSLYSSFGDPIGRIKMALRASAQYNTDVRGPFKIRELC